MKLTLASLQLTCLRLLNDNVSLLKMLFPVCEEHIVCEVTQHCFEIFHFCFLLIESGIEIRFCNASDFFLSVKISLTVYRVHLSSLRWKIKARAILTISYFQL